LLDATVRSHLPRRHGVVHALLAMALPRCRSAWSNLAFGARRMDCATTGPPCHFYDSYYYESLWQATGGGVNLSSLLRGSLFPVVPL
jgi:hypothetical protein